MFQYGVWRDKPAEQGFSKELISTDYAAFNLSATTDEDKLEIYPYAGIDTLYKALQRNVGRIPNHPMLGTKGKTKYEWMTVQ